MIHIVKITFLFSFLFITACDEDESSPNVEVIIYGCTNSAACNYNEEATNDDGACELNIFCYDSDGDELGYGDSNQFCDEVPDDWVQNCDDSEDDCIGLKDDCGECNGEDQSKDCGGVCFGTSVLDDFSNCCQSSRIQSFNINNTCLADTFKWSLMMTVHIGDYEDNIFIPSSDSANFIIGTHYLSTDSLDIFDDITYSDIVKPPTIGAPLSIYTSYPEWDYFAGNHFIQEFKFHDIENLNSQEGISWDGEMSGNYYGQKYIKISFMLGLDSEDFSMPEVNSDIVFNFNDYTEPIVKPTCNNGLFFTDFMNGLETDNTCDVLNENFEYIIPIIFQGSGYPIPFNITINNTYLINQRDIPDQDK